MGHAICALVVPAPIDVARAEPPQDAFATIGLAGLRSNPEHLERYADLCDELGV